MSKKTKNIVVLHGVNILNAGDLGIIHATIQRLVEIFPDFDIKILSPFKVFGIEWKNKYKYSRQVDVKKWGASEVSDFYEVPISGNFNKIKFVFNFIKLMIFSKIDSQIFNGFFSKRHKVLSVYACADVFISKGGGFLHDRTGTSGIPPHIFSMLLCLQYKAPLVIYAQSIGPFKSFFGKLFTKYILNRAKLLLIREGKSINYIKNEMKVDNINTYLTADEAFLLKPEGQSFIEKIFNQYSINNGLPVVGYALCNWGFPNSTTPGDNKARYIDEMAKSMDLLVERYDANILIACHVEKDGIDDDRQTSMQVLNKVKNKVHLLDVYDDVEIKAIWGECDLFVGTRMHSNIFALSGGVPTIAISYLHKTEGIMQGLGLEDWVLKIDDVSAIDIINLAQKILDEKRLTKEIVLQKVEKIKERACQNALKVKDLID